MPAQPALKYSAFQNRRAAVGKTLRFKGKKGKRTQVESLQFFGSTTYF
jgi:hypothetical protein